MTKNTNQFVDALKLLSENKSTKIQNGFLMLKANYRSEGKKISASKLAKAAGYSNYGTGNEQYGSFAHEICNLLGIEPQQKRNGSPIWTFAICDSSEDLDNQGHFQWILKENVAEAMEILQLVKPLHFSNPYTDIKENEEYLCTLPANSREAVINARVGQGVFRERLVKHWGGCSVTGCDNTDLLIASHIKPWRDCSTSEALDMTNGLLLLPSLDLAFDKGFISFKESGDIIISPQLGEQDLIALGINKEMKLRWCHPHHDEFLKYHRKNVFRPDV